MKAYHLLVGTLLLLALAHQNISPAEGSRNVVEFVADLDESYAWYIRDYNGYYLAAYLWDNRKPEKLLVLELRIPLSANQSIGPQSYLISEDGTHAVIYSGGRDLKSYVGNPMPLRLPPSRLIQNPSGEGLIEVKVPLPYESKDAKKGKFIAKNVPSVLAMETDVIVEISELEIVFSDNTIVIIPQTQFKIIVMPA